jgi:hypothetical protein
MTARYAVALMTLVLLASTTARADFVHGLPQIGPGGHFYEIATVSEGGCRHIAAQDVLNWADAQSFNGWPGHLLTVESQAEHDGIAMRGILGAFGGNRGPYTWMVGPNAGTPVVFYGGYADGLSGGTDPPQCAPFSRLLGGNKSYWAHEEQGAFTSFPGSDCGSACYMHLGDGFFVEYEPASTVRIDPSVGGQTIYVGLSSKIIWVPTALVGNITSTSIEVSRTGPGGPWQQIAQLSGPFSVTGAGTAVPSQAGAVQSSFDWTVTGPATQDAYFRVTVTDAGGNIGRAVSFPAITIDVSTPVTHRSWGAVKTIYR